ncbi:hypothetical protein [Parolsenella catena]|uniref:hypothetical protein n=1 Tax=Parolsenella catena TaxID=2003188 RepID=UPI002943C87D|nr:hypothetical protein [Parolsenella catena]
MTDRNVTLKKLLFGYHAEASTMLRAGYYDVDDAIGRFIAYIESEKVIRDYLEDCVENYVPEGFDAKKSVEKVSSQYGMTFAHFSPDYRGESGEVYLILKAILGEGGMTKGNLLLSYMNGSKKYDDMVKNFMNKVVRKLVDGIDRYLTELGIEKGLSDANYFQLQQNVNTGDNSNVALGQSSNNSTVNVRQTNGINGQELDQLLGRLEDAFADLDDAQRAEAEVYRDGLRDALSESKPKLSIIKAMYTGLKKIDGGVQFVAALAAIGSFLQQMGILVP